MNLKWIFLPLVVSLFGGTECGAKDKADDVYQIRQEVAGIGPLTTYVSSSAVKIIDLRSGWVVVAAAPDWRVSTYSAANKAYREVSLQEWMRNGMDVGRSPDDFKFDKNKIAKTPKVFEGLNCVTYEVPIVDEKPLAVASNVTVGVKPQPKKTSCEILMLPMKSCAQSCDIARKILGIPVIPGAEHDWPLYVFFYWDNSPRTEVIRTMGRDPISVKDGFFRVPAGLKSVTSYRDVTVNEVGRRRIQADVNALKPTDDLFKKQE
jgi:hypothetical protein